jgi:hypothetical protein
MIFAVEKFSDIVQELKDLIFEHWREVTSEPETRPLDVHWDQYFELEKQNMIFALTARADGRLVGYIIHLIYRPLHYRYMLMASDDAHFLKKEFRKGPAAMKMFKAAEKALKELGVNSVTYHSKTRPEINKRLVFERLGYSAHEYLFVKHL